MANKEIRIIDSEVGCGCAIILFALTLATPAIIKLIEAIKK